MNILKSAELKNFRGYWDKNNTVEFRPGINLILGDNATGKSSIVALIMFSLLNKKIDVAKYEDYRTIEPKDLGVYRAGLTLIGTDDKEYSIYKSFDGRAVRTGITCDGTELRKVGELELSRRDEAQSFILQRFGATAEMLEFLLVQMQEPAKLLWPVGEAREVGATLSKLLRFEPLQNVFTNAKSCQRLLLDKVAEFQKEAEDIQKQIEKLKLLPPRLYERKVQRLEKRKEAWEQEANKLEAEISKSKEVRDENEEVLDGLRKKQGSVGQLGELIANAREGLKEQKRPKETVAQIAAKRDLINEQLQRVSDSLENTARSIGSLRGTKAKAENESKTLIEEINGLSKKYSSLVSAVKDKGVDIEPKSALEAGKLRQARQTESQQLTEAIGGLREKEKAEAEYIEILSQAKANCPVCDTRLTVRQRREIIREKSELITKVKNEIKDKRRAEKDASEIAEVLDGIQQLLKDMSDRSGRLARHQREARAAEKRLEPLVKRQDSTKSRQAKLKKRLEELENRVRVAEKFKNLKEWTNSLKAIKKELLALPRIESRVAKYKKKIERLETKQHQIENHAAALAPEIKAAKQSLENAKAWYDQLATSKKKAKVAQGFADEMGLVSDAAKAALHELFRSYGEMVNFSLRWIWPTLYPRSDLRQIELDVKIEEAEERGEKTLVTETRLTRLGADGQRIPFNTISSHGQRVLASIAFRVAFLNLLWKTSVPRILVLDEPTIWIDNQNRERLGQLLANLVKEVKEGGIKLEQVIIISHDPAFLNAIDPEGVKHICVKNEYGFCEVGTASS
jgi:DNA repair exonuclease SbcCD ATPase subunit